MNATRCARQHVFRASEMIIANVSLAVATTLEKVFAWQTFQNSSVKQAVAHGKKQAMALALACSNVSLAAVFSVQR